MNIQRKQLGCCTFAPLAGAHAGGIQQLIKATPFNLHILLDMKAICLGLVITGLVSVTVFLSSPQKLLNETESRLDSVVIVFH